MIFQSMYWPITATCFLANSFPRYAISRELRIWRPMPIIRRKTENSSATTTPMPQDRTNTFWASEWLWHKVWSLMYAYTTHAHRPIGTSPAIVILPCESSSAAIFESLNGSTNNMQRSRTSRKMLHRLFQRIELMKAAVSSRLTRTQRRYIRDFEKNVLR